MSDWLEHRLNERFAGMDHPFDAEAAWQQLESKRKKRKRGIAWWWLGGAGLAVIVGLGIFLIPSSRASDKEGPSLESIPQHSTPLVEDSPNPSTASSEPSSIVSPSATSVLSELSDLAKPITEQALPEKPKQTPISSLPVEKIDVVFTPSNEKTISTVATHFVDKVDFLDLPFSTLKERAPHASFSSSPTPRKVIKHQNSWIISGGYGPTRLHPAPNPLMAEVEGIDHWEVGFSYRKGLTQRWWASLGIHYRQFTTRVTGLDTTFQAKTLEDQLIQVIEYPDGTTEEIYGPLDVIERSITNRLHWQQHPSLELQLLAGYRFPIGDHWEWNVGTGVSWGIMLPRRGVGQDPRDPASWQDLSALPYRDTSPLRWLGQTDIGYQVDEQWGVFLGIQAGMDLQNHWQDLSSDIQGIPDQRFRWITGTVGIRKSGWTR